MGYSDEEIVKDVLAEEFASFTPVIMA